MRISSPAFFVGLAFPALVWGADTEVTFSRDIAPLLQQRCVECHRDGGGAPFSLESYRDASRRASTILRVVEDRYMPPWHAIGGDIPLEGDRQLMPAQIELFRAWVEGGKAEGDPSDLPAPRQFVEGWQLGEPDLVIKMAEAYSLPADGPDIYRNFVVPTGLTQERFLRAVEFRPGSAEVVHHALLFVEGTDKARKADAEDEEPGFGEMPIDAAGGRQIGGWVPGARTRPLPEGLSHRIPAGADIVIQTHFHLSGKPESEQSTIGLYFTDEPPEREFAAIQIPPLFGAFSGIDLKPGEERAEIHDSFELPVPVHAFGAHAHAHYRGKSLRMVAKLPSGESLKLLNIPDWDMNWQEDYRFTEQVFLPAGTRLEVDVAWDNSAESTDNPVVPPVRVRWGFESLDEMGSIDLFVVPTGDQKIASNSMKTLQRAYRQHLVWCAGEHVLRPDKLAIFGDLRRKAIERFDRNEDGFLGFEERKTASAFLKRSTIKD
ncbi:MAG: cytochrome c [Verrucomicrobiae bacterium]|nr:cytochrome c [Verrucomicrobiae bacterium]